MFSAETLVQIQDEPLPKKVQKGENKMAIKKTETATKAEPAYNVLEKCGVISERNGKTLELRYVSWNGNDPKYDLRTWKTSADGEICNKGITLTGEELESLMKLLNKMAAS